MPSRRINDAQTERLLAALQSLEYRQKLARKLAVKDNIKYDSAMRRLERYVTKGAQKRSFARAPLLVRRETVKLARRLPVPADYQAPPRSVLPLPRRQEPEQLPLPRGVLRDDIPPFQSTLPPKQREIEPDAPDNYEYRAIFAYFDGDADEAASILKEFGAPDRTAKLLELAATGTDILGARGVGRLGDAVIDWYESLDAADIEDIERFSDLLREGEMAEWKAEIVLEDIANGYSTFADWSDVWRDSGYDFDTLVNEDDNEYWRLWRSAYARAKK